MPEGVEAIVLDANEEGAQLLGRPRLHLRAAVGRDARRIGGIHGTALQTSPAHRILTGLPLLAIVSAAQAMAPPRCVLTGPGDGVTFQVRMEAANVAAAPVVDSQGRYVGVVSLETLRTHTDDSHDLDLDDLVDPTYAPIVDSVHLDVVLETLTSTPQTWAAVIDDGRRVVGTIAISDIVRNYRRTMQANLRRVSEMSGFTGISEITVATDSPLVDATLRSSAIPRGVLITAIERGRDVIRPTGETIIDSGDRLMVLGGVDDVDALGRLASKRQ